MPSPDVLRGHDVSVTQAQEVQTPPGNREFVFVAPGLDYSPSLPHMPGLHPVVDLMPDRISQQAGVMQLAEHLTDEGFTVHVAETRLLGPDPMRGITDPHDRNVQRDREALAEEAADFFAQTDGQRKGVAYSYSGVILPEFDWTVTLGSPVRTRQTLPNTLTMSSTADLTIGAFEFRYGRGLDTHPDAEQIVFNGIPHHELPRNKTVLRTVTQVLHEGPNVTQQPRAVPDIATYRPAVNRKLPTAA